MKLIVGLGNPGREYAGTRHNVGFRVADLLAGRLGVEFDRRKFKGEYASAALPARAGPANAARQDEDEEGDSGKLLLVKPQTYMNLSGETVSGFSGYFKISLAALLVVVDDVALPLGVLRLRRGGSDGGHKGLMDISQRLGSQEFARLRVGVGGREHGAATPVGDLADHVLRRFSAAEEEKLKGELALAADACLCWAQEGIEAAMNRYNAKGNGQTQAQD
ncbi:MAG: aminoacyl-tRNA hydrolase [Planctomycetota bacterium]|nr:aminoacyl-tRNA hydrolase [Planctomycetota bacterium]